MGSNKGWQSKSSHGTLDADTGRKTSTFQDTRTVKFKTALWILIEVLTHTLDKAFVEAVLCSMSMGSLTSLVVV